MHIQYDFKTHRRLVPERRSKQVKPIFHCDAKPFCVRNTNGLISKIIKICVTPTRISKFALPPTGNPNESRWNIGYVGLQTQNSCVGPVLFMLFVSISFALGSQRKHSFHWNMGLRYLSHIMKIQDVFTFKSLK